MADLESLAEQTASQLKGIIKHPKPDAKLLKRPPYRFLRDVVVEVAKQTNFLEGLFTPEESANDKASKDEKMVFLQKAIDATAFAIGEPLAIKPSKIVAGRDPELTNLWLQAIAGAASSGVDSSEAVGRVLAGEKPGKAKKEKENKEKPAKEKSAKGDKLKPPGSDKDKKPSSGKKPGSGKPSSGRKKSNKDKSKPGKEDARARDARPAEASRDRKSARAKSGSGSARAKSGKKEKEGDGGDQPAADDAADNAEDPTEPAPDPTSNLAPEDAEPRKERPPSARLSGRKRPVVATADDARDEGDADTGATVTAYPDGEEPGNPPQGDEPAAPDADAEAQYQQQQLEQQQRQQQEELARQQQQESMDPTADIELPEQALPGNVQRRERIARPTTARAAPPKRKKNLEDEEDTARGNSAVDANDVNVMVDDDQDEDDDADVFVVVDNNNNVSPMPAAKPVADDGDAEEEGALMRKIREKKAGAKEEVEKEAVSQAGEAARVREREAASKEIERLRTDIQSLTRSANPLGKIVDYIQEDVDAMQKEMTMWKKEHAEHTNSLSEEALITENEIQPIRVRLGDLDQQIKDQEDLIAATKCIVGENNSKIQRMLDGVAFAARS